MDLKGRLHSISRDYISKKPVISFILNEDPNGIEKLNEKDLKLTVVRDTHKRSLNSNDYFHVLCRALAVKNGITMNHQKNDLITYLQLYECIDEEPIVYKTNCPPDKACEFKEPHMLFVKRGDDGAYWYKVCRGSSTYSVSEMHELIEHTIQCCRDNGIPTATPDEIAKMELLWGKVVEKGDKENDREI